MNANSKEYVSADGKLRFRVDTADGDVTLGFVGFYWHTHADLLAAITGLSEAAAVENYVQDLLCGRAVIALSWVAGSVQDVWLTEDPAHELVRAASDETIELRYWNGRTWFPN